MKGYTMSDRLNALMARADQALRAKKEAADRADLAHQLAAAGDLDQKKATRLERDRRHKECDAEIAWAKFAKGVYSVFDPANRQRTPHLDSKAHGPQVNDNKYASTRKKIRSMCRRKPLPGTAIARKLELSPEHTRRVLAYMMRKDELINDDRGYRSKRAT